MVFALLGAFATSCTVVLYRYILRDGENPLNLTAWVSLLAVPAWIFLFNKHINEFKKLSTKNITLLIFIGIVGAIGINYLQVLALKHTTAVNFSFVYRTVTVFTVLFAWLFLKEKFTFMKGILVTFIVAGSYLITTEGQGLVLSKGDIYSLLMAASAAFISNILIKHTISKMHPDLSGSVVSGIGGVSLAILASAANIFEIPANFPLVAFGSLLYFALIMFRNRAYKYSSASFVSMVFGLSPMFVVILSYFFLGEVLKPIQLLGGAIIIGATIFTEKFKM